MKLGFVMTVLLVAILGIILLKLLVPALAFLSVTLLFLLAVAAVVSVILARKPANTKILWLIIVILAPVLGPLLWFIWGKNNT
jgi:hypothetical protein